jgi:hypothetical protein
MGKKNKSKQPKGRAAAKQKAKKSGGSGSSNAFHQYIHQSPMSRFQRQMLEDDDGGLVTEVAPSIY